MGARFVSKNIYAFLTIDSMKVANPVDQAILGRARKHCASWAFTASDFLDLGSRDAVDKALSRMAAASSVRRLARGLYDIPIRHPIVGLTSPSVEQIIQALGRRNGTRIQPTGAYAANLLGLSDQVPAKLIVLTNGRNKRVRIGKMEIQLKQTEQRFPKAA